MEMGSGLCHLGHRHLLHVQLTTLTRPHWIEVRIPRRQAPGIVLSRGVSLVVKVMYNCIMAE
jgi:hypothetical protein